MPKMSAQEIERVRRTELVKMKEPQREGAPNLCPPIKSPPFFLPRIADKPYRNQFQYKLCSLFFVKDVFDLLACACLKSL